MRFFMCKLETDIWILYNGDMYEYISGYANDSEIAMRDPKSPMNAIENMYKFKPKGT